MKLSLLLSIALKLGAADLVIFVDDSSIAARQGVRRVLHQASRLPAPVLQAERPWEGRRVYTYGSVHFDPARKLFEMWYNARIPEETAARFDDADLKRADLVLHATSTDGLHWTRTNAGIFSFDGSKSNNVVHSYHSPSVVVDPSDPSRRYRMAGYGRKFKGYSVATSADGLHWKDVPGNPIVPVSDTVTMTRNPATGEYMVFHKQGADVRGFNRRSVYLTTSTDFQHWSKPELVLAADAKDDEWAKGPRQRTEFYVMSAFPYAGQFLGLVSVFRIHSDRPRAELKAFSPTEPPSGHDGPIDIQLVSSKDGHHWTRTEERKPVIALGPKGSYDAGCILGVSNPVIHGDQIWVYYTAITTTHGGDLPEKKISIGRAAFRLDGFASLYAEQGSVETARLELAGKRVLVNSQSAGGRVELELLGGDGKALPGFTRTDFQALQGDGVRQAGKWKGGDRAPARAARVRAFLTNAHLYALRLE